MCEPMDSSKVKDRLGCAEFRASKKLLQSTPAIVLKESDCETWVFRKKTHMGVLLNFDAVTPP